MAIKSIQTLLKCTFSFRWIYLLAPLSFLSIGCEENWEPYEQQQIILNSPEPPGGVPGTLVKISGSGFSPIAEENSVTINGLSVNTLYASKNDLVIKIPDDASFVETELIVSRSGFGSDTATIIVSENPLARITGISPEAGPPGTIVTIYGNDFNPDEESYVIFYEDSLDGFFVPRTEDDQYISTLLFTSKDSLKIQIPEGFQKGSIRLNMETVGQPLQSRYTLRTAEFTVNP